MSHVARLTYMIYVIEHEARLGVCVIVSIVAESIVRGDEDLVSSESL